MTTELRSLRWGSNETLTLRVGETTAVRNVPRQMLQLAWDVPLSWVVILNMLPQFDASENHTFTVVWTFTFGVGQATGNGGFTFSFAPSGGVYTPITSQIFIAGQDVQAQVSLVGTIGATQNESFQFSAFGAPNNSDVLGELRRWEEQSGVHVTQAERDMAMGGPHEPPLRYMPR